jgi:hypothetical protein
MVLGFEVPPPPKFGGAPRHLFTALARVENGKRLVISLGAVWFVDVQFTMAARQSRAGLKGW